jgi:G3E family GTPase
MPHQTTARSLYLLVGGFLGAGKTTAILQLARLLNRRGRTIGLISNDQSYGLVDTRMFQSAGFPVEEITGGCFCCKFNSLVEASNKLARQTAPDVYIAEPVGSCTDLKATVDYPLRRLYGEAYRLAPLSVLVDPIRALRILGLESGKSFSQKVAYIYGKQLEEAEIIVVNKIDLLSPQRLRALCEALQTRYPRAKVLEISARDNVGLEAWLEEMLRGEVETEGAMEVDYDHYAEGEALLGWLNAAARIAADVEFDGNAWLTRLAQQIHQELGAAEIEVAHMKLTLNPNEGNHLAVANLVVSDQQPELAYRLEAPVRDGELIFNLRAEADPGALQSIVAGILDRTDLDEGKKLSVLHMEAFRPGRPTPTHRLSEV